MNLRELIPILESIAPPELAEDFDKAESDTSSTAPADIQKIAVALTSKRFF